MPARVRLALMVFASLAILAAAGVIVFTRPDPPPPLGASGFAGGLRPAIPPKDFTLRDQDGRAVSLRALPRAGRGADLHVLDLPGHLPGHGDHDPRRARRPRPRRAGARGQRRPRPRHARLGRGVPGQARPQRAGACASCWARAPSSQPIWHDYGIRPQGNGFEHSAYVLLIDKRGRQRISFPVDAARRPRPGPRHPQARGASAA